jgi:hypothetical protein
MASLIQVEDSNATVYISSVFFGQLRTIRDIGGNRTTSNTISASNVGRSFSDGSTVKIIDTPYATLTVNPSTGRILHAFPFSYNQSVSTISITDTGSMNIYGRSKIFDHLIVSTISSSGPFDAAAIKIRSIDPILRSNLISTVNNLDQYYTSSVHIPVDTLKSNDFIFNTDLFSTVANLPYVSTPSLQSTIEGLGTFGYISQMDLTSTITGLSNTYTTRSNLHSTVQGLGTAGYVSTADFISTFSNYQEGSIRGDVYKSTVDGLGNSGYVSSQSLLSTVQGLATFGYISTSWLVSTTTKMQDSIQGSVASALYVSTAQGLGQTYMSTQNITSTYSGIIESNTSILTSTVAGLGTYGYISTSQMISTLQNLGMLKYISSGNLESTVKDTFTPSYSNSFPSTSAGLGSLPFSYISTPQLVNLVSRLQNLYSNTLITTVAGLGQAYVSLSGFQSTFEGLGSPPYSYMSSSHLVSNVTKFLILPYNQPQLTSTVQGLGSIGYISGGSLAPIFLDARANYLSLNTLTTNVQNLPDYVTQEILVSYTNSQVTSFSNVLSSNLVSTFQNLGSLGYVSTPVNPSVILISSSIGIANRLAAATYPSQTTSTLTISGSSSNIFKYVNGSIVASAAITVSDTQVNTQNLYTTCNLTATSFYARSNTGNGKYFADGTELVTSSDRRLKKDIVAMSNALEKINALTGIYFTWKDDPMQKRNVGFLAQDVEKVFPELIFTGDGDDTMKSVKYESLHVAILEAIKELDAELDSIIH